MDQMPNCPKCNGEYVYHDTIHFVCPDCGNEWSGEEAAQSSDEFIVKDSNGNQLQDGDSVILIKDLKVKGSSLVLKKGSKAKNIRLVDSDHNVDCKIDGVSLALKSEFLKKA
ncbi:zinc ribbon domain-containing protein YjdM [Testudinibacter sp. TR-2022]|uniref:zinc ribbon domain-containing protein YjdM n=1 Tax=Testudinibacter sp. TR-2022 TaxID=2585029 RepID=UPI0011181ED8|nr:zinc ribbon domain-containing protein YjdM [Testudinibacter sp. TR-2022]TNG94283.1 alkylphosphonate utilization protein [Pasteurellaceae bacterium UScroc12]TNG95836.1 alkylphosphonate utilization protein [Pasteurellaceae bacterium USgator41]TNH00863.1 alkylphosphonate utilization protein [Pasteurellaceae bacterium UScroc31]TNH02370.1 alkylphosphonate utilization protein [Pasteurellaceae bacterium USgator11]TNH06557.1 alkylphosphonate utilization protein [Pasteurellaceae bacterium Phil11]